MSDTLREWLVHQLGPDIQFPSADDSRSEFRNGLAVGKILRNYGVVSDREFSQLVDGGDGSEQSERTNFRRLEAWLATVDVPLDGETAEGMIAGDASATLGFLYRLCFCLENPNSLNLTGYARRLNASLGCFDFLAVPGVPAARTMTSVVPTHDGRRGRRERDAERTTTVDVKKPNKKLEAFHDKIDEFERGLPAMLDSWNGRGDRSCIRYNADESSASVFGRKLFSSKKKKIPFSSKTKLHFPPHLSLN